MEGAVAVPNVGVHEPDEAAVFLRSSGHVGLVVNEPLDELVVTDGAGPGQHVARAAHLHVVGGNPVVAVVIEGALDLILDAATDEEFILRGKRIGDEVVGLRYPRGQVCVPAVVDARARLALSPLFDVGDVVPPVHLIEHHIADAVRVGAVSRNDVGDGQRHRVALVESVRLLAGGKDFLLEILFRPPLVPDTLSERLALLDSQEETGRPPARAGKISLLGMRYQAARRQQTRQQDRLCPHRNLRAHRRQGCY